MVVRASIETILKDPVRATVPAERGASILHPTSVPDLGAWYDGESEVTVETGVSQWSDSSGNGENITQPATGAQPGRPDSKRIFFDGSQQQYLSRANYGALASLDNYTILMLAYPTMLSSSSVSLSLIVGDTAGIQIDKTTSATPDVTRFLHRSPYGPSGGNRTVKSMNLSLTQPQIYIFRRDIVSNLQSIYIDGNETALDISGDPQGSLNVSGDGFYLGVLGTITPIRHWTGYLYQVLIYRRALIAQELLGLSQFLQTKK